MSRLMALSLSALFVLFPLAFTQAACAAPAKLVVTGKLETGIMAIGGETTGTTVTTANDGTYELDIKDAALQKKADQLSGKQVTVTGSLTIKPGVETGPRRIITVDTLDLPAATTAPATNP